MKKIQLLLVVLFLSVSFSLFSQTEKRVHSVQQTTKEQVVYVTQTGVKYHNVTCRYLAKSKIESTRVKAIKNGYSACKICKPGGATTAKSKKKPSSDGRCTATTQKGARCKRNSASGSNKCWQH